MGKNLPTTERREPSVGKLSQASGRLARFAACRYQGRHQHHAYRHADHQAEDELQHCAASLGPLLPGDDSLEFLQSTAGPAGEVTATGSNLSQLFADQLAVDVPGAAAMLLNQIPAVAQHRIEPLHLLCELGKCADELVTPRTRSALHHRSRLRGPISNYHRQIPCFQPWNS